MVKWWKNLLFIGKKVENGILADIKYEQSEMSLEKQEKQINKLLFDLDLSSLPVGWGLLVFLIIQ